MTSSDDIQVSDIPDRSRFEIMVDDRLAGFAEYRLRLGQVGAVRAKRGEERGFQLAGPGQVSGTLIFRRC